MSDNKALWNRVCVTDPKAVKAITGKQYKGNSPKPFWIVERMTDEFGPCGIGWGFTILNERMERLSETDLLHVAVVRLWYMLEGKRGELEQIGQTKATYKKSDGGLMVDEDAPKKSVTDALVKCASYLGFAGDIFSGRWDDSKYVAEANREWRAKEQAAPQVAAANSETDEIVPQFRRDELAELASFMVDSHLSGKDMDAIRVWYAEDSWSADNEVEQEERKFVWGLLKTESKLRSTIKANNPHKQAA
jgi:hypothetical protein